MIRSCFVHQGESIHVVSGLQDGVMGTVFGCVRLHGSLAMGWCVVNMFQAGDVSLSHSLICAGLSGFQVMHVFPKRSFVDGFAF